MYIAVCKTILFVTGLCDSLQAETGEHCQSEASLPPKMVSSDAVMPREVLTQTCHC